MRIDTVLIFFVTTVGSFAALVPNSGLTQREQENVMERVRSVYSGSWSPQMLFHRPEKYSVIGGRVVEPNADLKLYPPKKLENTLSFLAQKKGESRFLEYQCGWLKNKFPNIQCQSSEKNASWEGIDHQDRVELLTESWVSSPESSIDDLPVIGQTAISLWSDDYWKLAWGGTSYRYGEGTYYGTYTEAVNSYFQPSAWIKSLETMSVDRLEQAIEKWSPAEKYDLIVNNLQFTLTKEQKREGEAFRDENGDVESWMGLCHGWAAAAIMTPKPNGSIKLWGPSGTTVKWFPHDVRALTTLAWANGNYRSNFVGQRCNLKNPTTLSNGRIKDSDCFDNNPGTFHLALANLIGIARASFVMDAAFDYQVWNQPVAAYEFTYFNPLNPIKVSKNWKEVSVNYDSNFKLKDPFQNPLTRGKRLNDTSHYDDSQIDKVVGVIATVVYLGEVHPIHGDSVREEKFLRVSYSYDLELKSIGDRHEVVGGEWHTNAHPDFLWVPQKGVVAHTSFDLPNLTFDGHEQPSEMVTHWASQASSYGYPLCPVISTLLENSTGTTTYHCSQAEGR